MPKHGKKYQELAKKIIAGTARSMGVTIAE